MEKNIKNKKGKHILTFNPSHAEPILKQFDIELAPAKSDREMWLFVARDKVEHSAGC